jgi:hypothetical protein
MKHEADHKEAVSENTAKERPPLASPYELASIAIALATLHQKEEPDMEGAVKLLRDAAFRVQNEKRPIRYFPDSAFFDDPEMAKLNQEAFARMGAKTIVQTAQSHPEVEQATIQILKRFEGADKIMPPKNFPASSLACWRAVLKRSPGTAELQAKKTAILKALPSSALWIEAGAHSEGAFWIWASGVMPLLPERGKKTKKAKRSRKGESKGLYTTTKHGMDGKFKKK